MKTEGIHQKYIISKVDTNSKIDSNAEYFVLRLDYGGSDINHINACRKAIHAYADTIEATIPDLSSTLRERYPILVKPVDIGLKNYLKNFKK